MHLLYGIALGMAGVRPASSQIVAIVGRHKKRAPQGPVSLPIEVTFQVAEGIEEISKRPAGRDLLPLLVRAVVPQRLECPNRHLS